MLHVHNKESCEVVILSLNGKYMTPSSLFLERGGGWFVGDIEGLNLKKFALCRSVQQVTVLYTAEQRHISRDKIW